MLGLDYTPETLEQKNDDACELQFEDSEECRAERDGYELFVQDDWFIADDWELLLGARQQQDSDFGEHYSPKLNLRHQLVQNPDQDIFLRLGWGNGYRVPNLKERYYIFDHSQLGYKVIGNPDLQPEESSSWQAGIGFQWCRNLTLDINVYHNRLTDLIQTEFDYFSENIAYFRYLNVESASTQGIETTLTWDAGDTIALNGGYTYLDSENETTGTELTRRPNHQAVAGIDWKLPRPALTTSLRLRGQSDELIDSDSELRSPGWAVWDLKFNYGFDESIRLFGGLDNLFNRQRDFTKPGLDFGPLAGRYLYLGFQLTWEQ